MNNLMIDLETMGKNKDAPIVSIGAVFFTPETGDIGQEFYTVVSLDSAMKQGATPDGDTILWWLKQSSEARAAICIDDTLSISDALSELSHFINQHADNTKYLKVWGNGATFDNVIYVELTSEQDKSARGRTGMTTMYARSLRLGVPSDSTQKWTCLSMANGTTPWLMPVIRQNMFPLSGRN